MFNKMKIYQNRNTEEVVKAIKLTEIEIDTKIRRIVLDSIHDDINKCDKDKLEKTWLTQSEDGSYNLLNDFEFNSRFVEKSISSEIDEEEIPSHVLDLCTKMVHYSIMTCPLTKNLQISKIREALQVFFTNEELAHAINIISRRMKSED